MRKITLFLDFDGVTHPLHCHESKHFSCLHGLEEVLREMPSVEVVISSTWRHQYSLHKLKSRFSVDIADRIAGVTPTMPDFTQLPERLCGFPRHAECLQWMRTHRLPFDAWLAIDDRPYLFEPFFDGLVVTESRFGATTETLEVLRYELLRLAQLR